MKKIYIITLFLLSGSVLAHSPLHNDFESMMKRMFNHMQMMDMHHSHLFEGGEFNDTIIIAGYL